LRLSEQVFGYLQQVHLEGVFDAAEPHVLKILNLASLYRCLDGLPVVLENKGDFNALRHGGRKRVGISLLEAEFPKNPLGGEVCYAQTVAVAM